MERIVRRPPPLPHEHGAWVMVILPLLFGAVVAGPRLTAAWLVPPSALLVFLARSAWVPVLQRRRQGRTAPPGWSARRVAWGSLYGAVAGSGFACMIAWTPAATRTAMVAVALVAAGAGLFYAVAEIFGHGRRVVIELVGMAGLSLSAPVMGLAAGRPVDGWLLAAAALVFAYFASSLAFVRAYGRLEDGRRQAVVVCLAAHAVLTIGLVWLFAEGWLAAWSLVAFAPVLIRAVWGMVHPPRNLRGLGMREIWVATSFAALGMVGLAL